MDDDDDDDVLARIDLESIHQEMDDKKQEETPDDMDVFTDDVLTEIDALVEEHTNTHTKTLTPEQSYVYDVFCNSESDDTYLLLGAAGTGKTYLAKRIAEEFGRRPENMKEQMLGPVGTRPTQDDLENSLVRESYKKRLEFAEGMQSVAYITNTWASAMMHDNGMTVHSYLGMPIGMERYLETELDETTGQVKSKITDNMVHRLVNEFVKVGKGAAALPLLFVLDEACAWSSALLSFVIYVTQRAARTVMKILDLPKEYGPRFLILGDPKQNPHIPEKAGVETYPFFASPYVQQAINGKRVFYLETSMRQLGTDEELRNFLALVRDGRLFHPASLKFIKDRIRQADPNNWMRTVYICGKRSEMDAYNNSCVAKLEALGKRHTVEFHTSVHYPKDLPEEHFKLLSTQVQQYMNHTDKIVVCKVGMKVSLTRKISSEHKPGRLYYIVGISRKKDSAPYVVLRQSRNMSEGDLELIKNHDIDLSVKKGDLTCGLQTFEVGHASCEYRALVQTLPVKLSFGGTTHMYQGLTIEADTPMEICLSGMWMMSQFYVAASRARTASQIHFIGWMQKRIETYSPYLTTICEDAKKNMPMRD